MQQLCFIGFMTLIYLGSRIFSIKKKGNCNRKKEWIQFIFAEFVFGVIGVTLLPIYIRIGYQPTWDSIDINIRPFYFIEEYRSLIQMDSFYVSIAVKNLLGNVLLFLPFGFLIPLLREKKTTVYYIILVCFCVSFCIEIFQTVERFLGIGLRIADIDDILLNCLGGLTGFGIYKICSTIWHLKTPR